MPMIPVLPMHGAHGVRGVQEASLAVVPLVGGFTLLMLLLAGLTALYLWRSGRLSLPALGRSGSAEQEAKHILAERFARGDITSDDFLERASMLNWTPGADPGPRRHRRKKA
jgi:putative membrane protein